MRAYPYLRAYMAGIAVPTALLLVILVGLLVARNVYDLALPVERVVVFPMAVVPNAWGLWNVLHVALASRNRLPLGWHGALLFVLLPVVGYGVTRSVGVDVPALAGTVFLLAAPVGVIIYYLAWKHLVGFLNQILGIHG